jgi:hypothetical protein
MTSKVRIPIDPSDHNDYMNRTDDLQIKIVPPSTVANYEVWGWKDQESDDWSAFRTKGNQLYALYSDPDKVNSVVRKKMAAHIVEVRKYDNDKTNGHFLLDLVAQNGSVDDCVTFNVVRGTILQHDRTTHDYNPSLYTALVNIENNSIGQHILSARCQQVAKGYKLPDGMKFLQIFRYIGSERPKSASQYTSIGFAKKGKFISTFPDVVPVEGKTLIAYYYGCLVSIDGKQGTPGPVVDGPIMLAGV